MDCLRLNRLAIDVHLGCSREEQAQPQAVEISVEVHFATPPMACSSDQLADTLCYDQLCTALSRVAHARPHQTIEALTTSLVMPLTDWVGPRQARWVLQVHKIRPPIAALLGGVTYTKESPA